MVACSDRELIPPLNVVHISTSPNPLSNSVLLELKRDVRKGVGKGQRQVLVKNNHGGPHQSIGGLTQACAGSGRSYPLRSLWAVRG